MPRDKGKGVNMKKYETSHLVKGEDLNHHGTLFAAKATAWLIEAGFVTAACEHGKPEEIVLRGLQEMTFDKPVAKGSVVCYEGQVIYVGKTSLMVWVKGQDAISKEQFMEGFITFVTIDSQTSQKKTHQISLDQVQDAEELTLRERALKIVSNRN